MRDPRTVDAAADDHQVECAVVHLGQRRRPSTSVERRGLRSHRPGDRGRRHHLRQYRSGPNESIRRDPIWRPPRRSGHQTAVFRLAQRRLSRPVRANKTVVTFPRMTGGGSVSHDSETGPVKARRRLRTVVAIEDSTGLLPPPRRRLQAHSESNALGSYEGALGAFRPKPRSLDDVRSRLGVVTVRTTYSFEWLTDLARRSPYTHRSPSTYPARSHIPSRGRQTVGQSGPIQNRGSPSGTARPPTAEHTKSKAARRSRIAGRVSTVVVSAE